MKKNTIIFILASLVAIVTLYSCTKIQRTYLLKGQWEIDSFTIGGGSENMVAAFFADHEAGNGKMILNFSNSGVLKSDHYSFGEIDSTLFGTWSMPDYETNVVRLGDLVDATFTIEVVDPNHVILHTDKNLIRFYDIGEVTSVIEVSKVQE